MKMIDILKNDSIIASNLNIEFESVEEGHAALKMTIDEKVLNPYQIVHGGAIFTLADSAAGAASISLNSAYVTMDSSINILNPGVGQYLLATAKVIYIGEKTCVVEVDVHNDQEVHIAKGMFTMYKIDIGAF